MRLKKLLTMNSTERKKYDVVIAGGGMIGIAMALSLSSCSGAAAAFAAAAFATAAGSWEDLGPSLPSLFFPLPFGPDGRRGRPHLK